MKLFTTVASLESDSCKGVGSRTLGNVPLAAASVSFDEK